MDELGIGGENTVNLHHTPGRDRDLHRQRKIIGGEDLVAEAIVPDFRRVRREATPDMATAVDERQRGAADFFLAGGAAAAAAAAALSAAAFAAASAANFSAANFAAASAAAFSAASFAAASAAAFSAAAFVADSAPAVELLPGAVGISGAAAFGSTTVKVNVIELL